MRRAAPHSVRAIALLLVGLLPLQVGVSGLLGAAAHREMSAHGADSAVMHDQKAEGAVGYDPTAEGAVAQEQGTRHELPEGDAHDAPEPCADSGPCDTGLMTCSGEAPCATVAFFPVAGAPSPSGSDSPLAADVPSADRGEDAFTGDTPPPRA